MHPLIFLLLIALVLVGLGWVKGAPPAQRTRVRNQVMAAGAILLLLTMVVRGGLHPLIAAIGATVSLVVGLITQHLMRHVQAGVGQWASAGGDEREGHGSTVRTRFLRAHLDHQSGEMDAEVLEGTFRGRRLSELDLAEHRALLREVGADAQSRALLEAYLERVHGDRWSSDDSRDAGRPAGITGAMTDDEAREILGVDASAKRADIVDAHRRLMQKLHPDRGGSTYLAAKINQAKSHLLGDRRDG